MELKPLVKSFARSYSASSYTFVFDFIKDHVDILSSEKHSKLAGTFFKSMSLSWVVNYQSMRANPTIIDVYANLAARCKINLDWEDSDNKPVQHPWSRDNLLVWFTGMSTHAAYQALTGNEFLPVSRVQPRKKRNAAVAKMPDEDPDYLIIE